MEKHNDAMTTIDTTAVITHEFAARQDTFINAKDYTTRSGIHHPTARRGSQREPALPPKEVS
jgi:hypothetical protein